MAPSRSTVIALFATAPVERFLPVVQSLATAVPGAPIVIGGPAAGLGELPGVAAALAVDDVSQLLTEVWHRWRTHVLLVGEPVVAPARLLHSVQERVEHDPAVATVSFWSNAAGFASFPFRNQPLPLAMAGHDPASLTAALRGTPPALELVPVAHASGAAVLLTASALGLVERFELPPAAGIAAFVADLSATAQRHGLVNLLDPNTYVLHAADLCRDGEDAAMGGADGAWFAGRHPVAVDAAAAASAADDTPLGLAFTTARTKVAGMRVLVDAAALGPVQTGAQVGIASLVRALAERDDVSGVVVAVPGAVPAYARALGAVAKVTVEHVPAASDLGRLGTFEVAFRPSQPDAGFDVERLRRVASRVVVTILDLITFQIGDYHHTPQDWLAYRAAVRERVAEVDGVMAISSSVRAILAEEQLPLDPSRVAAIPFGVEHVRATAPLRPVALPAGDRPFLLCLGTNYAHKNRQLAMRAHRLLVEQGHGVDLVLAGAAVAFGSSRVEEAWAELDDPPPGVTVHRLPDVTEAERNWLLQQAEVVLYPTSAEGFGLVPYEAALLGTPTVFVPFGPLAELAGEPPVSAPGWEPGAFAAAVSRLRDDPMVAAAQVDHFVARAADLTWERTAAALVQMFRALLARPPLIAPSVVAGLDQARHALAEAEAERDDLAAELGAIRSSRTFQAAARMARARRAFLG